ncbi:hypothetical protein GGI15_000013 [Coemansia interrupta]|uniref:Uncharacterized protein n=1 Tax=Coemansia interrupta TaxID=1126814 RepID=A0A9W8HTT2_9FUNG|nr:hypothetical protein GGI15_000013 [Coemansia interrupta]
MVLDNAGAATRHQVDENANSNPEYIVAGNAANYSESAAAAKSDARASSAAGIGVASKPTTNSVEPKETDDIGEDNRIPEFHHPGIPIELYIEYEPLGPEVKSSQHATELELELWYEYKCGTKDLKGAYFGTFGDTNRHAVVAYSSRHLSAWSPNDPYTLTNLTDVLPKCNIKTLVPLSDEILGLVADVKSEKGTYTRNRMMLFDINAALDEEPREAPLSAIWPNIMPGSTGVSKISWLGTRDGHTYFLSSAINSNEVHVHSFTQDNGAFTDISNTRMNVYLKNPVSAIGFDPVYSVAVAGSVRSQMSVVDVSTSGNGYLQHTQ